VAGAINGSPLADAFVERYKDNVEHLPLPECARQDLDAIEGLQYAVRLKWLREHEIPRAVAFFSLVAFTRAHEVSPPLRPFAAALAYIDPRNDGQLLHYDQIIPGSMLLGYVNADHWAVATPIEEQRGWFASLVSQHNHFPRQALIEAILLHVTEATRQ
jgi:hypothetical protein